MARPNKGGWDFVQTGGTYQYKEEITPMSSFIAMVTVIEDNSDDKTYRFKLQVEESNTNPPTQDGVFEIDFDRNVDGYYSGMPQFYSEPEYDCNYQWVRNGGRSKYSPQRDKSVEGVRIVKLSEADSPETPNNIVNGYTAEGRFYGEPQVGKQFNIGTFETSDVVEIISDNTFRTKNSVYRWEKIPAEKTELV